MSPATNTQNVEATKTSHIVLDSDDWYTNFAMMKYDEIER